MHLDGLIEEYREEARQQLDQLDRALLQIEEGRDLSEEDQQEVLRILHTLKGNSAMMGLQPVADQVHVLENIFKAGGPGGDRSRLDRLFELSATLRSAIDRLDTDEQEAALNRVTALDLSELTGDPPEAETLTDGIEERTAGGAAGDAGVGHRRDDAGPAGEVLRVPFGKLDALLAEVGELVSFQAQLEELVQRNRDALAQLGLRRELEECAQDLASRATALRDTTMQLRLVPLRTTFGRFPSLVRELARSQGKRARLVIEGEETEVDKSAADALIEPLLHLLRNAVDHGLETTEERRRLGKEETGTVHLRAGREGDHICIEVADDGSGLDHAAILRRAREAGVIGADAGEPDDAAHFGRAARELIFAPGFSTRTEASTVSGRGIGLDIVRRGVDRLRGSLEVGEPEGGGTVFILRLPLTLAIVPALIFESEGEILALPASEVRETLPRRPIERAGAAEVVRYQEALVPLTRPRRIFGWSHPPRAGAAHEEGPGSNNSPRYTIVLAKADRTAAIPADRMIDQRNVVVKALPAYLGSIRGVSGVAIGADGRAILLLDSRGMFDLNIESQRRSARAQ